MGKPEEKNNWEDAGVDGILLYWISGGWGGVGGYELD
jgi:hypothetical protein